MGRTSYVLTRTVTATLLWMLGRDSGDVRQTILNLEQDALMSRLMAPGSRYLRVTDARDFRVAGELEALGLVKVADRGSQHRMLGLTALGCSRLLS